MPRDALDDRGRKVWDSIVATRGDGIVDPRGHLAGPFNAWLHAPGAGGHAAELGVALRFGTALTRAQTEVAIITVAARWQAEFEWWAHAGLARSAGIPDAAIEAIRNREPPTLPDETTAIVHEVAHQLTERGQVEPTTYQAALEALGDEGLVHLVCLCGYYTLVSFTLNAFDVPLPDGATPQWPRP